MILISRDRWKEFCKTLLPILDRLEMALLETGSGYSEKVRKLALLAQEDPQNFVSEILGGMLWGGMGSLSDSVNDRATEQALLDLADALKSEGLDTIRTNEAGAYLREGLKKRRR